MYYPISLYGGGAYTFMQVGGVYLEGVVQADESAGMDAPSKKTERGFDYSTFVEREPISATIEAWVEPNKYAQLAELREANSPFYVSIDIIQLNQCKLNNLSVTDEAEQTSHVRVTIEVEEVRTPNTETTTLTITGSDGESSSSSSGDIEDASLVHPEDEESSNDSGGGGPLGDIAGWLDW